MVDLLLFLIIILRNYRYWIHRFVCKFYLCICTKTINYSLLIIQILAQNQSVVLQVLITNFLLNNNQYNKKFVLNIKFENKNISYYYFDICRNKENQHQFRKPNNL